MRAQWNWWFNVIFSILWWCCAVVFCMCSNTFCIGTAGSKTCGHIFNSWNLRTASHERCVFASSKVYCVSQLSVCRPHWNGRVKVHRCGSCMRNTIVFWSWESQIKLEWQRERWMMLWQQLFSILAEIIFLLKFLLRNNSKSSFFRFGVEIQFWSCNFSSFLQAL